MKFSQPLIATLALLLVACQATPPVTQDIAKAMDEAATAQAAAKAGSRPLPPPPAVNAALLPSARTAAATPHENRFDISVKDADAADFFMGLVQGTPYNMLVQPGVKGKITLSLKNVTVPEVMEAIRNVYGYDYSYRNGIFEVMPSGLATRFFPIDYLNLKRIGMSRALVNSGQLAQTDNGSNGGSNNNSSSNSNGNNSSDVVQIPSTEISTTTDVDVWTELQRTLRALVGEGEGRQVVVSPQTGMVVVRAPSRELGAVQDFLKRAQLSLDRQVILEAKIIEVTLSDGFQSGINWAKLGSIHGNPFNVGLSGAALNGATPSVPYGAITPTDTNPLGGVFTGTYSSANFDGAIQLLKTQGTVQVLSSPRVSTVNNQKAVIKVGSDEFFVTAISSNNTTNSAGNTTITPNVTLTPFFSGIALDVTPQISAAGEITLHVHPSVTQVTDQQKQLKVFDQDFELPLAYSTSRETDTIVRARNGQVVVIGGLMQNKDDDSQAGAPGLADVPLLGYLFKQKQKSTTKSELVILLRPVVPDDDQWQQQVSDTRARLDALQPPLAQKALP